MVKRATPFVVVSNGKYRQIFSIVEKPSGELTVILRGGESVADGMHPTSPSVLNELRISIHLSKDSAKNGRTIKETVTIDGGTTKTSAAFIKDSSEDLLWPVKSLLCPDLDDPRYDISKKINSPVIICENYPKKSCSLMVHIVVCAKNRPEPHFVDRLLTVVPFAKFNILLYTSFLNVPTTRFGSMANMPTSPPRINDIEHFRYYKIKKAFPDGASVISDDDLDHILCDFSQWLFMGLMKLWKSYFKNTPELLNFINFHEPVFSQLPQEILPATSLGKTPFDQWRPSQTSKPE